MHFGTKSYLKSNRNHTAKQTLMKTRKRGSALLRDCLKLLLLFLDV